VPGRKPDKDIQMYRDIGGRTVNLFNEDKVDLIIRGTLVARGTESRPIVIDGKKTGRFGAVSLLGDKNDSVLEYVAIRNGLLGLRCYDRRSPGVSHCEFSGHSVGGVGLWDFSSPEIESCLVKNNKYGLGASDLCNPIIRDNDVQDNTASGIFTEGGSSAIITNNRVTGNNVGIATGDEAKPLIENNHLEGNGGAIGCWKESSPRIIKNVIVKNMGAVVISGSSSPEISENKFMDNGGGIACTERSRVVLSENEIKRNVRGVILSGSARAMLKQNLLESNKVGVFVSDNAAVQMKSNKFLECEVGVQLEDNARTEEAGTIYRGNGNNIIDKRPSF
jgi:parallel beta-helix repeat protein